MHPRPPASKPLPRRGLAAALVVLGAAAAAAQSPVWSRHEIPWPAGSAGPGTFTRSVAGRLVGPELWTSAVIESGAVFVLVEPQTLGALLPVDGVAAYDLAVRRDGLAPGADTLLVVGPAGLTEVSWDAQAGQFTAAVLDATWWVNARRLVMEDIDGWHGPDRVGIHASGTKLVVQRASPTGFELPILFNLGIQALDVLPIEYDPGEPGLELAVLTPEGLRFYTSDADWLGEVCASGAVGGIARTVHPGSGEQRLAWAVGDDCASPVWMLHHFGPSGADTPVPLFAAPLAGQPAVELETVGLCAGDVDGDGFDDLSISHRSFQRAVTALHSGQTGSAFTLSTEGDDHLLWELSASPGLPAPDNRAPHSCGDPVGAGHALTLMPFHDGGARRVVAVHRKTAAEQAMERITQTNAEQELIPAFFAAESLYVNQPGDDILHLRFQELGSFPQDFTHMQVMLWIELGDGAGGYVVQPQVHSNDVYELVVGRQELRAPIPDDDDPATLANYYLQLRFVELDGGAIVARSPWTVASFTEDEAGRVYLENLPGRQPGSIPVSLALIGNGEVGVVLVQDFIPPLEEDAPLLSAMTIEDPPKTLFPW